jgi:hypothetical protein
MVVTLRPSASPSDSVQLGMAWPSTITVQAPHSPVPQPYLVPVRLAASRKAHSSGVSSGRRISSGWALIVRLAMAGL